MLGLVNYLTANLIAKKQFQYQQFFGINNCLPRVVFILFNAFPFPPQKN